MGSGKTAVGQRLAEVLQVSFLDLDREIQKKTNKTISEIFENKGEIFFRKTEFEVLQSILDTENSYVLALGGGTPCYGNTMQLLERYKDVKTIFLQTSLPVLTERLFLERDKRPLISHLDTKETLRDFIRKHIFERNFYYNQANIKVKADDSINKIVSEIVLQLF